jgi:hypothetical protein
MLKADYFTASIPFLKPRPYSRAGSQVPGPTPLIPAPKLGSLGALAHAGR